MGSGCALLELKLSGLLARVVPVSSRNPSEEIPMRLKTHKDSAGNLRPPQGISVLQGEEDVNSHQRALSRRRSFSSRFRTNVHSRIPDARMLFDAFTSRLRAAVRIRPNAGAAELRLTMLVKREIIFQFNCSIISLSLTIFAATKVVLHKNQPA